MHSCVCATIVGGVRGLCQCAADQWAAVNVWALDSRTFWHTHALRTPKSGKLSDPVCAVAGSGVTKGHPQASVTQGHSFIHLFFSAFLCPKEQWNNKNQSAKSATVWILIFFYLITFISSHSHWKKAEVKELFGHIWCLSHPGIMLCNTDKLLNY